jgi:hypothetical protein
MTLADASLSNSWLVVAIVDDAAATSFQIRTAVNERDHAHE